MLYKFKSYGTEEKGRSIKAFCGVGIVTILVILLQYIRKGRKGRSIKAFCGVGIVTFLVILV